MMLAAKPVSTSSSALAPANHATAPQPLVNVNFALPGVTLPSTASVTLPSTASLSSITPVKPLATTVLPASLPTTVLPASKDALQALPRSTASAAVAPLPSGWSSAAASRSGEMRFNVRAADGRVRSSAVWSRVNLQSAAPLPTDSRSKTFGGVPVTLLRRTVINRMVAEGGWVINDVQRQLGERRVFIVTAQTIAAGGERRAWTFYFTESEGQVYSLATNAPAEFADTLAAESEQAIVALGSRRTNSTTAQNQK